MNSFSRRSFLQAAGAVSAGFASLQLFTTQEVAAQSAANEPIGPLGPLVPDPKGIFDLPKGFKYTIVSRIGGEMSDGFLVPGEADGMAAFVGPKGTTLVVRNHENVPAAFDKGPFGGKLERLDKLPKDIAYDMCGGKPCNGGTTTFIYDTKKQVLVDEYLSLVGTIRNCAGGPTPWNSWITCEESIIPKGEDMGDGQITEKDHGYNFEVPAWYRRGITPAVPLKEMGRFNHEAVCVDPHTSIVYQTEDRHDGLIYRYIPNQPGNLSGGGKLQALVVKGRKSLDTRNWNDSPEKMTVGEAMDVEWMDMDNVEAQDDDLRLRGFEAGAARFARGEGMWFGNGEVFFACTNGGLKKKGQVWRYVPSEFEGTPDEAKKPGKIELYVEPNDGNIIDNADNLTIAPWGDVIICEDGAGPDQFLRVVTPKGTTHKLGRNAISESELAGVCFSPDGSTLFVNIQHDGLTLAITGPWTTVQA